MKDEFDPQYRLRFAYGMTTTLPDASDDKEDACHIHLNIVDGPLDRNSVYMHFLLTVKEGRQICVLDSMLLYGNGDLEKFTKLYCSGSTDYKTKFIEPKKVRKAKFFSDGLCEGGYSRDKEGNYVIHLHDSLCINLGDDKDVKKLCVAIFSGVESDLLPGFTPTTAVHEFLKKECELIVDPILYLTEGRAFSSDYYKKRGKREKRANTARSKVAREAEEEKRREGEKNAFTARSKVVREAAEEKRREGEESASTAKRDLVQEAKEEKRREGEKNAFTARTKVVKEAAEGKSGEGEERSASTAKSKVVREAAEGKSGEGEESASTAKSKVVWEATEGKSGEGERTICLKSISDVVVSDAPSNCSVVTIKNNESGSVVNATDGGRKSSCCNRKMLIAVVVPTVIGVMGIVVAAVLCLALILTGVMSTITTLGIGAAIVAADIVVVFVVLCAVCVIFSGGKGTDTVCDVVDADSSNLEVVQQSKDDPLYSK